MQRLKEDHANAHWLAGELREIGVDVSRQDTNMVFVRVPVEQAESLGKFMKERGVLMSAGPVTRLVIHLDVNREQLAEVVSHWQTFLQR